MTEDHADDVAYIDEIMTKPFWEKAYADIDSPVFRSGKPSQEIQDISGELKPGAKVLDLGCGDGRNGLFLARQGFDVTAIDISENAIHKLNILAMKLNVKVNAYVNDMCNFKFPNSYDLIICHGCLHLVERDSWQQIIPRIKHNTNPGGTNIIAVFTDAIPPPDDLKDFCIGLFREGEIYSLYSDWEMLLKRSYILEDEHPGSLKHIHPINKLVARKPAKYDFKDIAVK